MPVTLPSRRPLANFNAADLDPTDGTIFPGKCVLFKCRETIAAAGSGSITCSISGLTVTTNIQVTAPAALPNSMGIGMFSGVQATSIAWPVVANIPTVFFFMGNLATTSGCIFGATTETNYVALGTAGVVSDDGVTMTPSAPFPTAAAGAAVRATYINYGTPALISTMQRDSSSSAWVITEESTLSVESVTPASYLAMLPNNTVLDRTMIGIYQFPNAVPSLSTVMNGLNWMLDKAINENIKTYPPQWMYL